MNYSKQKKLRERLIFYLSLSGVKQGYIARQLGMSNTMISLYKNRRAYLSSELANKLDGYLTKNGF